MGTAPCGSAKNDLDLLTTRETSHGIVGHEFRLQAEVSKVLLDLPANKGTEETKTLSLAGINL
jgi:hypothetical protein